MNEEHLRLTFSLTKDDLRAFARYQLIGSRTARWSLLAIVPILFVVVLTTGHGGSAAPFLIASGVFIASIVHRAVIRPNKTWERGGPELQLPQTMMFTELGIEIRTATGRVLAEWRSFGFAVETKTLYILQIAESRAFRIIPKHALRAPSDEIALRELLVRRLRRGLRSRKVASRQGEELSWPGGDADASYALVLWTGWRTHSWPTQDDQAVLAHFGERRGRALVEHARQLTHEFFQFDAARAAADLIDMRRLASNRFHSLHPEISDEAVEALAWLYTFNRR